MQLAQKEGCSIQLWSQFETQQGTCADDAQGSRRDSRERTPDGNELSVQRRCNCKHLLLNTGQCCFPLHQTSVVGIQRETKSYAVFKGRASATCALTSIDSYLDVSPSNPRNQSTPRGYLKWLKSAGQALGRGLPPEVRKTFRAEIRRITRHLVTPKPRSRALVLFSGPQVWEQIPLQVEVTDELHWGKPSLQQMAWLLDEHRPRGAVVVDGNGARFFRFYLGAVTENPPYKYSIDLSSWRKPYLVAPSTTRVSKQSGIERDRIATRVAQQRKHFLTEVGSRMTEWAKEAELSLLF